MVLESSHMPWKHLLKHLEVLPNHHGYDLSANQLASSKKNLSSSAPPYPAGFGCQLICQVTCASIWASPVTSPFPMASNRRWVAHRRMQWAWPLQEPVGWLIQRQLFCLEKTLVWRTSSQNPTILRKNLRFKKPVNLQKTHGKTLDSSRAGDIACSRTRGRCRRPRGTSSLFYCSGGGPRLTVWVFGWFLGHFWFCTVVFSRRFLCWFAFWVAIALGEDGLLGRVAFWGELFFLGP